MFSNVFCLVFVQVLFVINPAVQRNTEKLNDMVLGHHLAMQFLVPALMNFYTGMKNICGLRIPRFLQNAKR